MAENVYHSQERLMHGSAGDRRPLASANEGEGRRFAHLR